MTPNDWNILARHGITPDNLRVGGSLDLSGCTGLTALPEGLHVGGSLDLCGCTGLTALPDNLRVGGSLYLTGCTGLPLLYRDDRGYQLRAAKIGGRWWYQAGCRCFKSADEALAHWGAPAYRAKKRGAAYCEAIRRHEEANA